VTLSQAAETFSFLYSFLIIVLCVVIDIFFIVFVGCEWMIEHDIRWNILKLLLLWVIFDICDPLAFLHPFFLMVYDNSSV
jgi:hypothetical protein